MKEGDIVKFNSLTKGVHMIYFRGGNKKYVIQKRSKKQDDFFDMMSYTTKDDYVYLIPDRIPKAESNITDKLRFCNKKYLKLI